MSTKHQPTNFEYRSKKEINGWPLIHINLGAHPETGQPLVAKGVVAVGNVAIGIVSIGPVAFGIVTLAGLGLGIVSLGGIAIGITALGAIALGYEVALGAIVLPSKFVLGAIVLDVHFGVWSLIFAVFIAFFIWGSRKIKVVQSKRFIYVVDIICNTDMYVGQIRQFCKLQDEGSVLS